MIAWLVIPRMRRRSGCTRNSVRRVGVLRDVGFKHGVWLDSVLLQRSLGEGSNTPPMRRDG